MNLPISSTSPIQGAFWVAIIITVLTAIYPLASKLQRRDRDSRPDGMNIIHDPPNANFDIIAVHGLGAHPIHTWEGKPTGDGHPKPHLLRHLLPEDFPTARILSFAYNSDWLVNAPEKTAQQIGQGLLDTLVKIRGGSRRLPIVFIGHSFGGIVIKEALCASRQCSTILEDTCGIIFLGTPHQGSSLSMAGILLSQLTGFLGSNAVLLLALRRNESQLSDLEDRFRPLVKDKRIWSFYETKPTFYSGFPIGRIVDRESARGYSDHPIGIDTDHSGLNKFNSIEHRGYQEIKAAITKLRVKSPLERADDYLREKHYTEDILKIERLSGDRLPMNQCYINLAIVEQPHMDKLAPGRSKEVGSNQQLSPFSLLARQKLEMPAEQAQVRLADAFNLRERSDGTAIRPRKILIRGRAGVGKTTLCKKMVHDFIRKTIWTSLFDRVLVLFDDEYFRFSKEGKDNNSTRFAKEIDIALQHDRTLFILDGWDEVAGIEGDMSCFLHELLKQSNFIITSRPSAILPQGIEVDLELETIGFSLAQVDEYIENIHRKNADELKTYLQSHELVRGLVRIPMQLDAFCHCWDDISQGREEKQDTMTTLYQTIQTSLWRKDIPRLAKKHEGRTIESQTLRTASQKTIEQHVKMELQFLEYLAFSGLAADKIQFDLNDRNEVNDNSRLLLSLDISLPQLSFLRTSDPLAESTHQLYHFIHLTFQEYFAARYFVRHWIAQEERINIQMEYTTFSRKGVKLVSAKDFFKEHKYDAGYDIMWRFAAGLLDAEGEGKSARFFEEIEEEPVDLLGPTHQRLVMHCLSEATLLPHNVRDPRA
ncbi:hypothetical protein N3K66_009102 [Trichothecium roseum]|uniref:Uncharacterized protein n=1 Tax=Trichothecium roseum TaxID=47278 RepID=A0ACC0UPW3_9HYPO|nr:hypothetical protein N3K66_009102 [Trichothecium roseum]